MPIYIGTQKVKPSGIAKVYIGNQLVYENTPVLQSITLSGQTTSLNRGAAFSFGGTVTAHYSNGSTANVTSSTTFSGYNMSQAGTYTVTARYTENGITATATYTLTVNKAWSAVWTGSKTVSATGSTISGNTNIYTTPTNDGFNLGNYRITFTMSASGNHSSGTTTTRYTTNNAGLSSSTTTKPSSPHRWNTTLTHSTLDYIIVRVYRTTGTDATTAIYNYCSIGVKTDNTNKNLTFKLYGTSARSPSSNVKTSVTITKIEKYY